VTGPAPDAVCASALAIALGLAESDPIAYDAGPDYVGLMRCALCDATPPGGASTLTVAQHEASCPYRQARDLADDLEAWNAPPTPQPEPHHHHTGETTDE
jgi:hypothetical protein